MGTQKNRFPKRHQRQTGKTVRPGARIRSFFDHNSKLINRIISATSVIGLIVGLWISYRDRCDSGIQYRETIIDLHAIKQNSQCVTGNLEIITKHISVEMEARKAELRREVLKDVFPIEDFCPMLRTAEKLGPEEAANLYNELIELVPLPETYVARALFWAEHKHFELAMNDLDIAETMAPGRVYILKARGIIYLFQHQYIQAEKCIQEARIRNPFDSSVCHELSHIYILSGNPQQAVDILNSQPQQSASALNPYRTEQSPDTLTQLNLCYALLKSKSLEEARSKATTIVKHYPNNAIAYFYLGLIALQESDYPAAIEHYNRAQACGQGTIKPFCQANRAYAYMHLDDASNAEKDYLALLKQYPNMTLPLRQLYRIAFKRREYSLAQQYLNKADSLDPETVNYADQLQLCYRRYGAERTISLSKRQFQEHPDSPDAVYSAAFIQFEQGNYDYARNLANRILKLAPASIDAMLLQAKIDEKKGLIAQAIDWCNKAIDCDSLFFESYYMRGMMHLLKYYDYNQAILDFQTATSLNPLHAPSYLGCGTCQMLLGELNAAKENFAKLRELSPRLYEQIRNKTAENFLIKDNDVGTLPSQQHTTPKEILPDFESYFYEDPYEENYLLMGNGHSVRHSRQTDHNRRVYVL